MTLEEAAAQYREATQNVEAIRDRIEKNNLEMQSLEEQIQKANDVLKRAIQQLRDVASQSPA